MFPHAEQRFSFECVPESVTGSEERRALTQSYIFTCSYSCTPSSACSVLMLISANALSKTGFSTHFNNSIWILLLLATCREKCDVEETTLTRLQGWSRLTGWTGLQLQIVQPSASVKFQLSHPKFHFILLVGILSIISRKKNTEPWVQKL